MFLKQYIWYAEQGIFQGHGSLKEHFWKKFKKKNQVCYMRFSTCNLKGRIVRMVIY